MLRGKSLNPIVIKIRKTRRKESFAEMMFLFATRRLAFPVADVGGAVVHFETAWPLVDF